MATEIHFTRDIAGNIRPADDESRQAVMEMKPGAVYRATVVLPRNYKRLQWWWKLCGIVADNSERYPSAKSVSDMLKLKCGHFETVVVPGKQAGDWVTQYVPGSIAFGSMTEPDFAALCSRAVEICAQVLACRDDDIREALAEFFERKAK